MANEVLKKIFSDIQDVKMSLLLKGAADKVNMLVFPDGDVQLDRELRECAASVGIFREDMRDTFVYACVRGYLGCTRERLIKAVMERQPGITYEQSNALVKYVFTKTLRQRLGVTSSRELSEHLFALGFNGVKGDYNEIPDGIGEFGLVVTNPVPVNGVVCNEEYLQHLFGENGETIHWRHIGTQYASNSSMPVDVYAISDNKGKSHPNIYISSYHPVMSRKAPKGYVFRENCGENKIFRKF